LIISQTPLRISFAGGGTDLKDYWKINGGEVLSSTIDKYVYVIVKRRFDDLIYLNYSKKVITDKVSKISHGLIREAMNMTGMGKGLELTTLADIPSEGSGLGSSSSITVGLLNALYAYKGEQVTAERLAKESCEIEIDILGNPIGKQDQYAAAYGGLNKITFKPNGNVKVQRIKMTNENNLKFGSNLLLFYTNITRNSSDILFDQKKDTSKNLKYLNKLKLRVPALKKIIESDNSYDEIGHILDEGWKDKRKLSKLISNETINDMYNSARNAGAIGGKISGAGGGGFLLLYVPRYKQDLVRKELSEFREFPFMLEPDGSKIIFNVKREYWR